MIKPRIIVTEHAIAEAAAPAAPGSEKAGPATVSRGPKLEFQ